MRIRRRFVPLAAILGAAIAVLPAIASSETSPSIEAVNEGGGVYGESHRWQPTQVTVAPGGVVRFSNPTEVPHGVEWRSALRPACEEGAGKVPVGTTAAASATKWSGTCTFTQPGTYTFYCTVHGAAMAGTITVSSSGTTTSTTGTTTPPTTGTTTPTTPGEPPSNAPLLGSPSLHATRHGAVLAGSLEISKAGNGDSLEVDVFAKRAALTAKRSELVRVGRVTRGSVSEGRVSFAVKLDRRARRALARHRRLALTVQIVLTGYAEPFVVKRSIVVHV